jgi:hypothetical protein
MEKSIQPDQIKLESALHRRTKTGKIPKNGPQQGIPCASTAMIDSMPVGCSMIFVEPASTSNSVGSNAQSFATKMGAKISTTRCFVVVPAKQEMIVAVLVTRIE